MKDRLRFFKEMLSTAISIVSCALPDLMQTTLAAP